MQEASERRRYERLRLDGRMGGRATVLTDFTVLALSESGASLEMALPMALGSRCDITLNLSHVSVDLKGRVVTVQPRNGPGDVPADGPFVVGVDFESVEELDQGLLTSYLERERKRNE
jgi:hypothetical protein